MLGGGDFRAVLLVFCVDMARAVARTWLQHARQFTSWTKSTSGPRAVERRLEQCNVTPSSYSIWQRTPLRTLWSSAAPNTTVDSVPGICNLRDKNWDRQRNVAGWLFENQLIVWELYCKVQLEPGNWPGILISRRFSRPPARIRDELIPSQRNQTKPKPVHKFQLAWVRRIWFTDCLI